MLELRETDLPALFLILVVLPLVAYVILGKWSESSKNNERISLLAELAAEDALRTESLVAASVIPVIPFIPPTPVVSKNSIHLCARCSVPATTRCSQCKSVRYCSGKCQIIHWRQTHKHECQHLQTNNCNSSPMISVNGESNDEMNFQFSGYNKKQEEQETTLIDDWSHQSNADGVSAAMGCNSSEESGVASIERRSGERKVSRKSKSRREDGDASTRHKIKSIDSEPSSNGPSSRSTKHGNHDFKSQGENNNYPIRDDLFGENSTKVEVLEMCCSSDMATAKRAVKSKIHKSQKSVAKASCEQTYTGLESKEQIVDEPSKDLLASNQGRNGLGSSIGIMKMIGLRKSTKIGKSENSHVIDERDNKLKMLFPYEDFVKFFQYEVFSLSPRGLINCGNSCYCNAVLQCLTFTKPLTIYLLGRSHSKTCCVKSWCLMCELEQHVILLTRGGGPLSPGRILTHMRSINRQIGDGSQEDAHEFLRLLLTSMQSICLAGLGGENAVDPRLQETTFIQHTFGGRLKSKVKCLRCHHESERYENMMDLTLEIYGWVESLEDALTQFTTVEDLDGENMYRCGRCKAYVRARKQLSIHEAPNILTIVLKRFQEGSYGKINKCITFPEMLDMVPFMTGTDDIPPLYMLYGVVVHLDTTLNASFSGHYVSYVKDLLGNWLRIDDTEVLFSRKSGKVNQRHVETNTYQHTSHDHVALISEDVQISFLFGGRIKKWSSSNLESPIIFKPKYLTDQANAEKLVQPVSMNQVMSEGAYILFYSRSFPRPLRAPSGKQQTSGFVKHFTSRIQKPSKPVPSKSSCHLVGPNPSSELCQTDCMTKRYAESFSDATSSDWSIFTSSDEASFTTESRDSFSTIDGSISDPFSSLFDTIYGPGIGLGADYSGTRTVSCRSFTNSKPLTRFYPEECERIKREESKYRLPDSSRIPYFCTS